MLLYAYSIHDNKALVYSPPFYAATNGAAVRIVTDTLTDTRNSLARHPSDYVLFRVGSWDDSKGLFKAVLPLEHIVDLVSLVATSKLEPTPFEAELERQAREV